MNEDATPTFHITPADMYPAVMEKLVRLHDEVTALRKEIKGLPGRVSILERWSRFVITVAVASAVAAGGLAVAIVLKL